MRRPGIALALLSNITATSDALHSTGCRSDLLHFPLDCRFRTGPLIKEHKAVIAAHRNGGQRENLTDVTGRRFAEGHSSYRFWEFEDDCGPYANLFERALARLRCDQLFSARRS